MARDLYAILGLVRGASQASIREAYRDLARKYHPDLNPGSPDFAQKFREVQAAFDVLSDEKRQREYDAEILRSVVLQPPKEDYYTTLQISRNASSDEIDAAYREAVHTRGHDERVEAAFEVLRDPELRRRYNDTIISFTTVRGRPHAVCQWNMPVPRKESKRRAIQVGNKPSPAKWLFALSVVVWSSCVACLIWILSSFSEDTSPEKPTAIRGRVWHDRDADGNWDEGEPGLADWTVYLDANDNGLLDEGEPRTVTASDGAYTLADPLPGRHVVAEVVQEGWQQTHPVYDWKPYRGHWYALTNTAGNWEQCELEASSVGGHLVTINNAAENGWLHVTFDTKTRVYVWIGFRQLPGSTEPAGGWEWISGEDVGFVNWGGLEPTNHRPAEDYAVMRHDGGWTDWDHRRSDFVPTLGIIEVDKKPATAGTHVVNLDAGEVNAHLDFGNVKPEQGESTTIPADSSGIGEALFAQPRSSQLSGVTELAAGSPLVIPNPRPNSGDYFGFAVGSIGENIIVGSIYEGAFGRYAGMAYLFDGRSGKLLKSFPDPNNRTHPTVDSPDHFGHSVTSVGNIIVVGAPYAENPKGVQTGAVYLFHGGTGDLLHTFHGDAAEDQFGACLAASGKQVLVGAVGHDVAGADTGAVHLFTFTGSGWKPLRIPNPVPKKGVRFGISVAFAGANVLVGADRGQTGAAYLFDGETGRLLHTFPDPTNPTHPMLGSGDYFGHAVGGAGENVLVGALQNDVKGNDAGAAYLFDGNSGDLLHTFYGSAGGQKLGSRVTSLGNNPLVGTHNAEVAYVFDAKTGEVLMEIHSPVSSAGNFGYSVASARSKIIVGAFNADTRVRNAGAVYVFPGLDTEQGHSPP